MTSTYYPIWYHGGRYMCKRQTEKKSRKERSNCLHNPLVKVKVVKLFASGKQEGSHYNAIKLIPSILDKMKVEDKLRPAALLSLLSWILPSENVTYKTWKKRAQSLNDKKLFPSPDQLRDFNNWLSNVKKLEHNLILHKDGRNA